MKKFGFLLFIGLLVISSCSSNSEMEENLIGTWNMSEKGTDIKFMDDGTMSAKKKNDDNFQLMGKYRLNEEEKTLELYDCTLKSDNGFYKIKNISANSMILKREEKEIHFTKN